MSDEKKTISVPVGLEQLLFTAAVDSGFRGELVRDRVDAAARRGLRLTASERAALEHAPAPQLEAMIDRIDTSEQNLRRRKFLRAVAATAVTLAAGTGLGACGGDRVEPAPETDAPFQGAAEEVETNKVELEVEKHAKTRGIRPDPPDAGSLLLDAPAPDPQGKGGARSDAPEPLPTLEIENPELQLDGGARPDFE